VAVTVESNPRGDPYEVLPGALAREGTRGFPVSTAQIEYPRQGYAAAFGWIQMVKASDGASTEDFGIDPIALCQNMQTPYGWFGIKPTLFDAPATLKPDDMAWICQSYLCFTPNAVVGPHVRAVAGFEWGFVVQRDRVTVRKPSSLSEDAWNDHVPLLRTRYPELQPPPREDICYATQNRQDAVKAIAPRADVVLVIGSKNSSNSNRLAEVARELGAAAYLVDDETEVDPAWVADAATVGVTSGASAPEHLVTRMLSWLAVHGFDDVESVPIVEEGVRFSLPAGVRESSR